MIKREIVETTYEYDIEGRLISKRVTKTKEEDDGNNPSWTFSTTTTDPAITHISYDPTLNDSICHSPNITCNPNITLR